MIPKDKFKNLMGNYYLKGLFYETTNADKASVVYTLKDEPHEGYPSLYQLYMREMDLTEFVFSKNHLANWEHWERLCGCSWFQPYIERWRKELELKIRAEALNAIIAESRSDSKSAYQAAKFLVERGWAPKNEKGRPTKEDVKLEANRIAEIHNTIQDDLERILRDNSSS